MKYTLYSSLLTLALCIAPAWSLSGVALAAPVEMVSSDSSASFDMTAVSRFGFGNILLGGWTEQNGWISAGQLQNRERFHPLRIWGGEQGRVYGLNGLKGEGVFSAIHSEHPGEFTCSQDDVPRFETHTPGGVLKEPSGLLTILCPWDVQPRKAVTMKNGNVTYQGIVRKYLAARGLQTEQPVLTQLFKIDLEGDGVDEVLICAQNIADKGAASFEPDQPLVAGTGLPEAAQPGAYSLLLLRKIVDGKVVELPLHCFVSPEGSSPMDDNWTPPVIGKACQFSDLNGDGVLEIVVTTAFYEGYAHHVFEVKNGKARHVLTQGMGS